jgi:ribosome-associated protein
MDIRKLQRAIVDGLEDVKAQNIVVFNTEAQSPLFERVIVASGTSNRQTKALAASVRDAVRALGEPPPRVEGEENGEWIIVDCGAAVAHIMQPAIREYYHLEEIWGAKPVRLKSASARPAGLPKAEEPARPAPARKSSGTKATAAAKTASPSRKRAPGQTAAAETPARKTPARKAAAREKPAREASARETSAGKAPARKTSSSNTPARKTPASKTPARKTSASKTPARKTPARKTARAAGPASSAPSGRESPAAPARTRRPRTAS